MDPSPSERIGQSLGGALGSITFIVAPPMGINIVANFVSPAYRTFPTCIRRDRLSGGRADHVDPV